MTASNGVRIRAGDKEREETAERLRDAHVDGRLTVDELQQRLDQAYGAAHLDELPPLVADLPRPTPPVDDDTRTRRRRGWAGPPSALVLLVVVLSVALVVSDHPPFPLLWLGIAWLVWHRGSFHRRPARPRF